MKNVGEFYEQMMADEALKEKFFSARKKNEENTFLKEMECNFTSEELREYISAMQKSGGEIPDDALSGVNGGEGGGYYGKNVGPYDCCEHFRCIGCGKTYQELLPESEQSPNGCLAHMHDGCMTEQICYNCEFYDWWEPICLFRG